MTTAQDVLTIAGRQIGYKEVPDNLTKFGTWYGNDGVPWCAIYVSYCFYNAGLPLPISSSKGFTYCPSGVAWFKQHGQWFHQPQVGDVVFFDWKPGTTESDAYHVGIVETVNPDGSIISLEGNTSIGNDSNGGQVMRRDRHAPYLLGFGRPTYSGVRSVSDNTFPSWPGIYITLTSPPMTSNDILKWQQQMISRGWIMGAGGSTGKGDTGTFDKNSYDVLKKFQAEKGLDPDGVLGPLSWNAAWLMPIT